MDFQEVYQKLKLARIQKNLVLKFPKYLRRYLDSDNKIPLELRNYQRQAVLHLITMNNFVLGDDTGLGKTLECISALAHIWSRNENQKVIIITTKSSSGQWVDEFSKFTYGVKTFLASSKGGPKKRLELYEEFLSYNIGPCVLVTNYNLAKVDFKVMQSWSDFILILDECSAVKSTSSQTHQACKYLAVKSNRVWGVSATIIKNNLMEGYGIYKVILPSIFGTKSSFIKEFCVTKMQRISNNRKIPIVVGYKKKSIQDFKDKIDPYFLGRPKHEVAEELPILTCKVIRTGMTPIQSRLYENAINGFVGVDEVSKLTAIVYCQQITNHPRLIEGEDGVSGKLEDLVEIIKEGDLSGDKVIIFSRFKRMVNIIMERIGEEFPNDPDYCVRVTGDEDDKERKTARDLFQDPESGTKIICITMAGGEAINLQAAKAIVFYDTPWSAGDYLQILGRMIRIGSIHEKVYSIHLVCEDTIDQHVMEVLSKKMELVEGVLGKRLLGDSSGVISGDDGTNDLYNMLKNSGKKKKKEKENHDNIQSPGIRFD